MIGPKPKGFWSGRAWGARGFLHPGRRYRIVKEFVDFDGDRHSPGDEWEFVGHAFLPYEDGLSLFVGRDDAEWHIRMQIRDDHQKSIMDNFEQYVALIEP